MSFPATYAQSSWFFITHEIFFRIRRRGSSSGSCVPPLLRLRRRRRDDLSCIEVDCLVDGSNAGARRRVKKPSVTDSVAIDLTRHTLFFLAQYARGHSNAVICLTASRSVSASVNAISCSGASTPLRLSSTTSATYIIFVTHVYQSIHIFHRARDHVILFIEIVTFRSPRMLSPCSQVFKHRSNTGVADILIFR